jgi:hypothetical protein
VSTKNPSEEAADVPVQSVVALSSAGNGSALRGNLPGQITKRYPRAFPEP